MKAAQENETGIARSSGQKLKLNNLRVWQKEINDAVVTPVFFPLKQVILQNALLQPLQELSSGIKRLLCNM
ncbi:hypothetical protein I2I11_06645 [Pontibacter sp. 172403-2]|uniref:hypothetical protein n=1 Tax=Pontibacter rufus TaxID=2791028 RepID=UPI0018AF9696|nr:hypothetical protein [Pontibacter sp. 172403-2]MBF9252963.1 hypothetical protein [Pontibacter sp. 172403-2]